MAEAQASGSMTPEQLERHAINKRLDWNLYNLSEILSIAIKNGISYDDEIVSKQEGQPGTYRDVWDVYNKAFSLKQKDWVSETAEEVIADLKSVLQQ